jgi:uncharacterized protein YecE (DUF72 family)
MTWDAAAALATPPPAPHLRGAPEPARVGDVWIGTASWTERTLLASGAFYPDAVKTPADRLRYYARHFPVVEVDATYYALPAARTAAAWADRTPPAFRMGVKAFAAMTGHPIEPRRLPADLRKALSADWQGARLLKAGDLPRELRDEIWARFRDALGPLRVSGKLAYVLIQLPPWSRPSGAATRYLESLGDRLPGDVVAVEFREATWMDEVHRDETLDRLRRLRLAYVCVDEPQGTSASVPPIAAATRDDVAVVRFHGRRRETWTRPGVGTTERFRYRYTTAELGEWVPRLRALAHGAHRVYALMNNCHEDSAVQGGKDLARLLHAAEPSASGLPGTGAGSLPHELLPASLNDPETLP